MEESERALWNPEYRCSFRPSWSTQSDLPMDLTPLQRAWVKLLFCVIRTPLPPPNGDILGYDGSVGAIDTFARIRATRAISAAGTALKVAGSR